MTTCEKAEELFKAAQYDDTDLGAAWKQLSLIWSLHIEFSLEFQDSLEKEIHEQHKFLKNHCVIRESVKTISITERKLELR